VKTPRYCCCFPSALPRAHPRHLGTFPLQEFVSSPPSRAKFYSLPPYSPPPKNFPSILRPGNTSLLFSGPYDSFTTRTHLPIPHLRTYSRRPNGFFLNLLLAQTAPPLFLHRQLPYRATCLNPWGFLLAGQDLLLRPNAIYSRFAVVNVLVFFISAHDPGSMPAPLSFQTLTVSMWDQSNVGCCNKPQPSPLL